MPQTQAMDCSRCFFAWRTGVVAHGSFICRNRDFGVADGFGICTVHTGGKRTSFRRVGAVQPAQPFETTCRALKQHPLKDFATEALRNRFVVS